jgi:hypothetical protein
VWFLSGGNRIPRCRSEAVQVLRAVRMKPTGKGFNLRRVAFNCSRLK